MASTIHNLLGILLCWYVRVVATPFEVLAEPVRRRILDLLRERPRSVGELTEQLGLTQPGTSKHLRVLRDAGLVRVRPEAQRRWYELRPEPLAELDAWLAPYRWMWSGRLDALERHLDTMATGSDGFAGSEHPPAVEPPPSTRSGSSQRRRRTEPRSEELT
ncbi:metalloregulator ArsR/SmtB family transcription factor [Plantactinospora sp. B6F1]|uniref:ArsR/SmtB family transcription factor n=1 Tax=Plantactinospora sp. B6F1 TaxID=3158971 RepID=UPI0010E38EFB